MTRPPDPRRDLEERRNARIRRVRAERGTPDGRRRTFQPVVLLAWFAGVIALAGRAALPGLPGLLAAADGLDRGPSRLDRAGRRARLRAVVPARRPWPTSRPATTAAASRSRSRTAPATRRSASCSSREGLIKSRLAFQWAVMQAGREGSLQAGTYDLSPSLRPSEIVAALRQEAGRRGGDHPPGGLAAGGDRRLPGHHQADHEPGGVRLPGDRPAARPDPRLRLPGRPAGGPHAGGLPGAEHVPDLPECHRPRGARHAADGLRRQPHRQDADRLPAPGPDPRRGGEPGQHRRARGGAGRGAAADRGRLPQPAQPPRGGDGGPAECRPDAPVRAGHGRVRSTPSSDDWGDIDGGRRCDHRRRGRAAARSGWPATRPT